MKRFGLRTRGKVAVAGAVLAVGLTIGVCVAVSAASATPAPQTARCEQVLAQVAQQRGISVTQLETTLAGKLTARIDARAAAGNITAQQAQALKAKLAANGNDICTLRAGIAARAGIRHSMMNAAATRLGITAQQLTSDLKSGKTLAQEAQAHNVSRNDLKSALRAALAQRLETAVAQQRIDRARADKVLAAFDARADQLLDRSFGK